MAALRRQRKAREFLPALDEMTPREIVAELDKYIVGQGAAKRAVAVALRNRVRRQKLPAELAEDILPKKYIDDWSDGRGQNGNRAAPCAARWMPVCEGGSFEIHGSWIRGSRRGIHGARPRGNFD